MLSQKTVSNQKGIQNQIVLQDEILQLTNFQVFQIDKQSKLFISQAIETIDDWEAVFFTKNKRCV